MDKLTRCINCKKLPNIKTVTRSDEYYDLMLEHICCPTFSLVSYQNTREECIESWNEFNNSNKQLEENNNGYDSDIV